MQVGFNRKAKRITFVEVTLTAAVLAILAAIVVPFLNRANQKGKMTKWKGLRNELLLDRSLKAYYDFSDGEGMILKNSVKSTEQYDPIDFDARILPGGDWKKDRWKMKWALDFNGESTHVFSKFRLPEHGNSLVLWFKTKEKDVALFSATESRNLSSKSFRSLVLSKGSLVSSTLAGTVKASTICTEGGWHMAAVTVGTKYNKHILYLDGEQVGSIESFKSGFDEKQANIFLGYSNNNPFLKGLIDEFLVFDRELSATEIKKMFIEATP